MREMGLQDTLGILTQPWVPPVHQAGLGRQGLYLSTQGERPYREALLSVERLAEAAGLSVSHFARAFKARTGHPPHRYLMRLRVAWRTMSASAQADTERKELGAAPASVLHR